MVFDNSHWAAVMKCIRPFSGQRNDAVGAQNDMFYKTILLFESSKYPTNHRWRALEIFLAWTFLGYVNESPQINQRMRRFVWHFLNRWYQYDGDPPLPIEELPNILKNRKCQENSGSLEFRNLRLARMQKHIDWCHYSIACPGASDALYAESKDRKALRCWW